MFSVYYKTPRDEALRVLVLVDGHPERLAALHEVYEGRHDVRDALWWRLHPLESSPRGIPDPATEREALQRQAFSRHRDDGPLVTDRDLLTGEPIQLTPDELRLRNLDVALAEDARALDRAIGRFTELYPMSATEAVVRPDPPHTQTVHRPAWFAIVAAGVAIVLLATVVALWSRTQQLFDRIDTASAASDPAESWRETNVRTLAALLVFNRAQTLDDVYPLQLPLAYDIRTVRQLLPYSSGDGQRVFGALAEPDQVCLVVVSADLSSSSACVSDGDFSRHGITLTTHATRVRGEDGESRFVSHRITWLPDGSFRSSGDS